MPIIRAAERPVNSGETPACGPYRDEWLFAPGGLTQFGAYISELPPGSRSSIKHWHSAEDELILMLEGHATLIEGDTETAFGPGDAAAFKAGAPLGHTIENRSDNTVRFLCVGTRSTGEDVVTYPDHDRVLIRGSSGRRWTDAKGSPADNPYKSPLPD